MTYANRWLLAVALKRPYPSVETGAEEPPPDPLPPPEFSAEELGPAAAQARKEAQQRGFLWGLLGGAVGAVLIDRLVVHRMLRV
jgi:hypothetical protein